MRARTIAVVVALLFALSACSSATVSNDSSVDASPTQAAAPTSSASNLPSEPSPGTTASTDDIIAALFAQHQSDVQVRGEGVVFRLLSDDQDGDRHQRFILELSSGQTLLIAHNIDIAPRLNALAVGDRVEFYGEYYYNEQGGGIHWTHHDPDKRHIDGWLLWNGVYFG